MDASYDILGIGNAIVDVVAEVDDAFISKHDMQKGSMALIDANRAEALTGALPGGQRSSGGSAANTCAVASGLGARVAYLGCVADDALGRVFRDDIAEAGVHFPSAPAKSGPGTSGPGTARCLIAVTGDGQRTMNTYLGACIGFSAGDVDTALVAQAKVTYLEGYLFDPPAAQAAFRVASDAARKAGRKVALSLSDAFCVDRHRAAFQDLLRNQVDILFANEAELCALYEVNDVADAIRKVGSDVALAAITLGERGSVIVQGGETIAIKPASARVVDTTGAGDAYAAGFLAAWARNEPLAQCGALGSAMAAEIIGHLGGRPPQAQATAIYASAKKQRVQETIAG